MRVFSSLILLVMAGGVLAVVSPAGASVPLIGNDWQSGTLYDVDRVTGLASNPRATGVQNLTGISLGPDGMLYGLNAGGSATLHKIDPVSGSSVMVGITQKTFVTEGDIDFDPISGTLFAIQETDTGNDRALFTVDPSDATTVEVGVISVGGDLSAMAFDASGQLWVLDTAFSNDQLLMVDKTDGSVMSSVALSAPLGAVAGMDFDPKTGDLYVADGFTNGTDQLYTLDTGTGLLTPVGATGLGDGLGGLEFVIPEPHSLSILLLGAMALVGRRRGT